MRALGLCLALACSLAAMRAEAACAIKADLRRGIAVEFDDGSIETHRLADDGGVIVEEIDDRGATLRWTLAKGVYHIAYVVLKDGRPLPYLGYEATYDRPSSDLPAPAPGQAWRTASRMQLRPDPPFRREEVFVFGETAELNLGGCLYETIPVEVTGRAQGDLDIVGSLYFPAIGTSVAISLYGEAWRSLVAISPIEGGD